MSPEESDHFAKTTPENIIPTNMLDKWKLQDDGSVAVKSRSVLVGWKDPMIYQLERAAPTPTQEGIMVTLQWLASAKVTGRVADLTNAFGQARKTSRKNKLATKLPPGVTHPKVGPGQLLRVENRNLWTCVGTKLGLMASLTVDFLAAGYKKIRMTNACSHCSLPMKHQKANCYSTLTMRKFYDKYRCGKAIDLRLAGQEGTRFAGRRVVQHPDFRITVSYGRICQFQVSVQLKFQEDTCQTPRK